VSAQFTPTGDDDAPDAKDRDQPLRGAAAQCYSTASVGEGQGSGEQGWSHALRLGGHARCAAGNGLACWTDRGAWGFRGRLARGKIATPPEGRRRDDGVPGDGKAARGQGNVLAFVVGVVQLSSSASSSRVSESHWQRTVPWTR